MQQFVLYGTGWYAHKFYYNFLNKESIIYCIDGYKAGGEFYGQISSKRRKMRY